MMPEIRQVYTCLFWITAIGGYLLLHYRQWQMGLGYILGAGFAGIVLWILHRLVLQLEPAGVGSRKWLWKGALLRYPLMLIILWAVSRQPIEIIIGFAAGVTLLPMSVALQALRHVWKKPRWFSVRYWAPQSTSKSREM